MSQSSSAAKTLEASNPDLNGGRSFESQGLARDCIVKRFSSQPVAPVGTQLSGESDVFIQTKDGKANKGNAAKPKDVKGDGIDVSQFIELAKDHFVKSLETSPGSTRSR